MSVTTKDGYDSGEIINGLLGLVRVAYDVKVMKHETEESWICSSSFLVDDEWFTLACKGSSYQGAFLELLHEICVWKQTGKMSDKIQMGEGERHPIETLIDREKENE
jgi:hypothetical protein